MIDRLFQEFNTFDGEMDYKTFLDFILAMEYKKSHQSIAVSLGAHGARHNWSSRGDCSAHSTSSRSLTCTTAAI